MVSQLHGATSSSDGLDAQGGEYRVTRALRGDQVHPSAALSAAGGFLVWQDNATDGDGFGISAVRVGGGLTADLEPFRVNVGAEGDQERPEAVVLEDGRTLVVWQSGNSIRGRLIQADGVFASEADLVISTHTGSPKVDPVVAPLTGGGALVIWASYGQDDAGSQEGGGGYRNLQGVFAQRLNASGEKIGAEFQVNQYVRFNQRSPVVTRLASGKIAVAFISERGTIGNVDGAVTDSVESVDVYVRFLSAAGEPEGNEFLASEAGVLASAPTIAASGDGFVIAWGQRSKESRETGSEILARFFDANGQAGGAPLTVNSHWYGEQFLPSVASTGGHVVVVWTSVGQDGSREGVYGQYLSPNGTKVADEFRVNTTTASRQVDSRIVARGTDGYWAFWSSYTGSPTDFELFGQRYLVSLPPAPQPVASALNANRVALAWPPVGGFENLEYLVYVDGSTAPSVTSDFFWNSAASFQPASTHSFRLAYRLPGGATSPLSQAVTATTFGADDNFDGLPDDWQGKFWGADSGAWPAPSDDSDGDGMKNRDEFLAGTDPANAKSLLRSQVKQTAQGPVLMWNTVPGFIYQLEESVDLKTWKTLGGPRFARSNSDQAPVESSNALRYYR
ncbi:MAG: hypothetical protein IT580_21425, partial [Verrucomicrobiales bacterium]|nr:hypothetical protein [Verrucomicrobiales bacterium]